MRLKVEKIQDINMLEAIREDWNGLLDRSDTKTVELTYEWQITYWKYFNEDAELFILIVKNASSIVAIAPLKSTRIKILGIEIRSLEIIAAAESNYQDLIIGNNSNDVLKCIFDYLLRNQKTWDFLNFKHISENSNTAQFLLGQLDGFPLRKMVSYEKCMYLEIDRIGEYPEELVKMTKVRKNLRYRTRRVERELGEICLEHSLTTKQFQSNLLVLIDLHRKRWNSTETPSMFNDDNYCGFYLEATQKLSSKRQILLSTLTAGEIILAQTLSFRFGNKVVGQLLVFDPDYIKYSPEIVLLELYIKNLIANGVRNIDFGSYNPYKERWTNRLSNRIDFQIYPKRLLPALINVIMLVYQTLLTSVRKKPFLLKTARVLNRKYKMILRTYRRSANIESSFPDERE